MEFGVTPRGYRFVAVSPAFFFLDNTRRLPHHNLFRFVSQNTMMLSAAVSRPHVRPAAPCARARSSTTPVACARILSVSYCGLSTRSGASEGALVDLGLGRMERRGSDEAVSRRSSVSVGCTCVRVVDFVSFWCNFCCVHTGGGEESKWERNFIFNKKLTHHPPPPFIPLPCFFSFFSSVHDWNWSV